MNRKQKRMADLREAKDKKMKKVAIGLSVVLVAVLAFEVPKVLHSSGSSAPAPAASTTATTPTGTAAPATTPTGTAAAAVLPTTATSTKLTNSDLAPRVGKSQLFSFSHFASKDPFAQQISVAPQGVPAQGSGSGSSSSSASQTPTSTATAAKVTHPQSTRTLAVTGAARISVNGRVQVVRIGATFPSANPLFRLVSVRNGVAKIAIASGSYSSGANTVSLAAGRSLTLVDTSDGTRYQIRLVA